MSFAPCDLVDRDLKQIAQTIGVDQLTADPFDDPADRGPVDPRQPAGRGLVGLRCQPRDEVLEIASEPDAVTGEWDALHQRAVLGATQPPQPRMDLEPPDPEIKATPDRVMMLLVLAMAGGVGALRAMKATTTQRDRDHHLARLAADRANPHPRQAKQTRECGRDAHGRYLQVGDVEHPRTYGLNLCASPNARPTPRKHRRNPAQTTKPGAVRGPKSPTIIHGASEVAEHRRDQSRCHSKRSASPRASPAAQGPRGRQPDQARDRPGHRQGLQIQARSAARDRDLRTVRRVKRRTGDAGDRRPARSRQASAHRLSAADDPDGAVRADDPRAAAIRPAHDPLTPPAVDSPASAVARKSEWNNFRA